MNANLKAAMEWLNKAADTSDLAKTHMYVERAKEDLRAVADNVEDVEGQLERAHQILSIHGVSRERAPYITNGICVLARRLGKEINELKLAVEGIEAQTIERCIDEVKLCSTQQGALGRLRFILPARNAESVEARTIERCVEKVRRSVDLARRQAQSCDKPGATEDDVALQAQYEAIADEGESIIEDLRSLAKEE